MLLARLSGYVLSSPSDNSLSDMCELVVCERGVAARRGDEGMRGEVCVRRMLGRDGSEFKGEPSGGVAMEDDTDEDPEAVEELFSLHTRAIG